MSASTLSGTFAASEVAGPPIVQGTTITLTFHDGALGVHGGGNRMSGPYDCAEGVLRWTAAPISTLMGLPDEIAAQDRWLAGLFTQGLPYSYDGQTLVLRPGGGRITLRRPEEFALGRLFGRTWTLRTVVARGTATPVPAGVTATVTVAQDGSVLLEPGCNTGRTRVEVDGESLRFAPAALTRRLCPGPAMEVERAVLSVLDGSPDGLLWNGSQLLISKGGTELAFSVD